MTEKVIALLSALGITVETSDPLLSIVISSVEQSIRNKTNQMLLPPGLEHTGAIICTGQWLKLMKDSGKLTVENIDLDAAVKQLSEGDTSVTFASGEGSKTPEQRLDEMINWLISSGEGELTCYRRIKW